MKSRTVFCSRIENGAPSLGEPKRARRSAIEIERALHLRVRDQPWRGENAADLRQRQMRAVADRGSVRCPPSATKVRRAARVAFKPGTGSATIDEKWPALTSGGGLCFWRILRDALNLHGPCSSGNDPAQQPRLAHRRNRSAIADEQAKRRMILLKISAVYPGDCILALHRLGQTRPRISIVDHPQRRGLRRKNCEMQRRLRAGLALRRRRPSSAPRRLDRSLVASSDAIVHSRARNAADE